MATEDRVNPAQRAPEILPRILLGYVLGLWLSRYAPWSTLRSLSFWGLMFAWALALLIALKRPPSEAEPWGGQLWDGRETDPWWLRWPLTTRRGRLMWRLHHGFLARRRSTPDGKLALAALLLACAAGLCMAPENPALHGRVSFTGRVVAARSLQQQPSCRLAVTTPGLPRHLDLRPCAAAWGARLAVKDARPAGQRRVSHPIFAGTPTVWAAPASVRVRHAPGLLARRLNRWRRQLGRLITRTSTGDVREAFGALLLGTRPRFSQGLSHALAVLGLRHLFAVSGLHLTWVAGLVFWLLRRCARTLAGAPWPWAYRVELTRWVTGMLLPLPWIVAALVGFTPSAVRAALLLSGVWAVSAVAGRRVRLDRILVVMLLLALTADPGRGFELGFVLSAVATYALVASPIGGESAWRSGGRAALAALVATLPWSLAAFENVPWLALPANVLLTPILAPALLGTAVTAGVLTWLYAPLGAWALMLGHALWKRPFAALADLGDSLPAWEAPAWGNLALLWLAAAALGALALPGRQRLWALLPAGAAIISG